MDKQEKMIVDGFEFDSKDMASEAFKEYESIKYIKNKVNFDDPDRTLKMYNKLIEEKLFKTPVGIGYLKELQNELYQYEEIDENIIPIPCESEDDTAKNTKKIKITYKYKAAFIISFVFNIIMSIMIVAMIYLASTSDNPTVVNYEIKIQDKYAKWAEELSEKEKALNKLEKELNEQKENSQN